MSISAGQEALLLARHVNVDSELLEEDLVQARAVAGVDPVADGGALLVALALAKDAPVVALGARDGGRQPDLLVWGLLVDDVRALVGPADGEDTRLWLNLLAEEPRMKS